MATPLDAKPELQLRPSDQVMNLVRLGSLHASRLSFCRSLVRQMAREDWTVTTVRFDLDADGHGVVIYRLNTPNHTYHGVVFSQHLDPELRSDRVIAEAWDVTFALLEGEVEDSLLEQMAANVPLQEAGRQHPRLLVLSRANKSLRNFGHFVDALASGQQPDPAWLTRVGYLYRTTAVYGNGKFGIADYARLQNNPDFNRPFSAQMFAVYLLRHFSVQQVEHLARNRSPERAVALHPALQRYLGIGNSTGLGMAPFLINHPQLIQQWVYCRERALAYAREQLPNEASRRELLALLHRAHRHFWETVTEDAEQTRRNEATVVSIDSVIEWLERTPATPTLWSDLLAWADKQCSLEAQELINTLLIELYPDLIDAVEDELGCEEILELQPEMRAATLKQEIEARFAWALDYDPKNPDHQYWFWYRSVEKEEPRLGVRACEPGAAKEMPLAIGPRIHRTHQLLDAFLDRSPRGSVVEFLMAHPRQKECVRRIQTMAATPYGEIQANLWHRDMKPMHLLRTKLSFFGASRFDPKSDRWVRVTLFQGAPLFCELFSDHGTDKARLAELDDWSFPVEPELDLS
ncbi:hypothetical protein ACP86_11075 [Marinobacter sp. CP1]|jgi:hypothetical protein|uniref:hypothetical protein n=1 Tax=unclassified Marinobacter TaxID=83889 RepID=UPI00069E3C02|nr:MULTISPECIES: hypothetical protein [unclassified Marinobacter]AKV96663.1 hypothetical protein ACP86_11075 [Marinobacter sp. CP1]MAI33420.1 hypothetical protein [Rhodopirellula sp.]